jgi:hypothetical protein
MRRLSTACSKTVHCAPDSWRAEVAEAEDGHVEESRAIPFDCISSVTDWDFETIEVPG